LLQLRTNSVMFFWHSALPGRRDFRNANENVRDKLLAVGAARLSCSFLAREAGNEAKAKGTWGLELKAR
jgi:hypothetical protein